MRYLIVISLLMLSLPSISQKTKLIKSESKERPQHKEEYYVLESDPSIRHGEFEGEYSFKFTVTGQYDNGVRSGVWEYSSRGELVQKIDFKSNTVLFEKPVEKPLQSWFIDGSTLVENTTESQPHFIGGPWKIGVFFGSTLRYPAEARRKNIQGVVDISCIVTEAGELIDEEIMGSPDKSLGAEALRVIKLMPDEWIAATVDGKPVRTRIIIPVRFKMEN